MVKQTSFIHQKEVLEQLIFLLQDFSKEIKDLGDKYSENVFSLYEEQGLMDEIYLDYKSQMNSIRENVSSILTKINDEHIPFVEKEIDFFSSRQ